MNSAKLFLVLSQIGGFLGLGIVIGANLAEGTSSVPLWIGGILIVMGAVLLGMSISARTTVVPSEKTPEQKDPQKNKK